ncbi:MAG: tail fiber domain-containing protein, partial [Chitinophagales bacterium]
VWTDISDASKKENITELDKNLFLEKIQQLKISKWMYTGTRDEYHIGPMAQEFHKLFEVGDDSSISSMDKTGVLFLGIQALADEDLRLKTEDVRQNSELENLKKKNENLKIEIANIKSGMISSQSSMNSGFAELKTLDSKPETILGQNIPNPFDNSTLIPFRIPKNCHDASIMITNIALGEVVSVIPVSCNEDHLSIDAGILSSGTYSYTLYVDGKVIDTKQMVIQK